MSKEIKNQLLVHKESFDAEIDGLKERIKQEETIVPKNTKLITALYTRISNMNKVRAVSKLTASPLKHTKTTTQTDYTPPIKAQENKPNEE